MSRAALREHDDTPNGDQIVVFHDVTWEDYERVLEIRGDKSAPRISYLEGELEIRSPSKDHEQLESYIGRLLEVVHRSPHRSHPFGSWTLKGEEKDRAAADECYIFGTAPRERPQLAIEVEWTRGNVDKLRIYEKLGVDEVIGTDVRRNDAGRRLDAVRRQSQWHKPGGFWKTGRLWKTDTISSGGDRRMSVTGDALVGETRHRTRGRRVGQVLREARHGRGGFGWSQSESNRRPPECDLRVGLGTYADISFQEQFTSVRPCPHTFESVRIRHALDVRAADSVPAPLGGGERDDPRILARASFRF
jgi:Uma2 family endonuclease